MIGTVANTFMHPIKGMHGVDMSTRGIQADTRLGIVGDRRFAIYRRSTGAPTEWKPKGQFHVCMNREGMATDYGLTEDKIGEDYYLNPDYVADVLARRNLPHGNYSLVDTGGDWHMADTNKPCISFLNLASVRWLEEKTGMQIDPRRFRMNVWIDGLEPWAELDYITAFEEGERFPMWVGDVQVHCDDICERCHAINQSPETGLWDMKLLDMIDRHVQALNYDGSPQRGVHKVMGWLAIPQNGGVIKAGQKLTFGTN